MLLRVKVIPGSGTRRIEVLEDGCLLARLNSRPIGGRANEELIRLLSKRLRVPKSAISICAGSTGRNKVVDISAVLEWEEIAERLAGRKEGRDDQRPQHL